METHCASLSAAWSVWSPTSQSCIEWVTSALDWKEALCACKSNVNATTGLRGRLLVIETSAVFNLINTFDTDAWIGLRATVDPHSTPPNNPEEFSWFEGPIEITQLNNTFIPATLEFNDANEMCGRKKDGQMYGDKDCGNSKNYLCEYLEG